jgi:hypothetical protein
MAYKREPFEDFFTFAKALVLNRYQLDWSILCNPQPTFGTIAVPCDVHFPE